MGRRFGQWRGAVAAMNLSDYEQNYLISRNLSNVHAILVKKHMNTLHATFKKWNRRRVGIDPRSALIQSVVRAANRQLRDCISHWKQVERMQKISRYLRLISAVEK